jgi:hypothetical protein
MNATMKSYIKILMILGFVSTLLSGCGGDDESKSKEEIQLGKLSHTWELVSAKVEGVEQEDYEAFELTLSGSANSEVFAYGVVGRPLISPWPAGGTWTFGSGVSSQIIRDQGTDEELSIAYAVTNTTLELDFHFSGVGYDASRVNSMEGHWVFTFTKK